MGTGPTCGFSGFFPALLHWRTANAWDNRVAAHPSELFHFGAIDSGRDSPLL